MFFNVIAIVLVVLVLSSCSSPPKKSTKTKSMPSSLPDLGLELCKTRGTNPPESEDRKVKRKSSLACLHKVPLLVAPAPKACLSSGFGRAGRFHKGLDYQSKPAGAVIAAGTGVVVEKSFREKDMGHWIVIKHSDMVYSGYAHLASVDGKISVGSKIKRGAYIGKMGRTGNAAKAIHLHFEIRHGNYDTRKKWWGLTPVDPFSLPEKCK